MAVRIGFAGTGGIAGSHLINLVRIPEAEVVALYDVDKERCDLATRRINGQQEQLARLHGGNLRLVRSENDWTEFEVLFLAANGINAVA